ncbi:MAG: AAA family ATPase [Gemmatimonadales bacterium]
MRLALEPGRYFTRDHLTDLLWPTAAPRLANHSLAQGLSVIKAKIAREAVLIQRATVALAAGWVDVDAHHLSDGSVSIHGPFLDAFDIPAARPFEEWKEEYRARLIPQMRDCLVRQMDAARRIGDFPTVEQRAGRLQELDPLAEEGIRGIMEARAWASDRTNALKAFARYESQLAEELGAKPGADLLRMADLLRDGRRSPPRPAVAGSPPERVDRRFEPETLIGREREFSVLFDAWLEARRKTPRIVVVTSDPGVGKTTLVNAFASSCQMDGAVVARAQAYDAERELPFVVLGELVKQLAAQRAIGGADPEALSELTRISTEIIRVFPGVPKPVEWSPEITPLRLADAFLKTVLATAGDSPVVLVVDDIHAADNASTAILHSVARKLTDARVLIILAGRTSELRLSGAPEALTSDSSIEGLRALELDVLPAEAAHQLVWRLAKTADQVDPPGDRILKAGGGNPLAIELLTREWAVHGSASLLHDLEALDTQPVAAIGIPRAIGAVFERQTRRLDPSIRAALDLAAVLGRRLTDVALYAAVDLSPGQAAESLSRLRDEGYLRDVRGDLEFRNELIRAQAYYALALVARQHLHRRVAELLMQGSSEDDKAVSLEIAWHYLRGGDVARAVPFALDGAEAVLAVGAPHEAEEILRAIVDVDDHRSNTKRIRLLLARALVEQSRADPALPIIEHLAGEVGLTLHEQAEVAMLRASAEFSLNREPGAKYCEVAKHALEASKHTGDPSLISQALFECARAGTEEGLTDLVRAAEKGIEEFAGIAGLITMPMTILTKAFCRFFFGDALEALHHLQSVERLSSNRANWAQLALINSGIGIANHFLGRFGDAYSAYSTALDLVRKVGDDARVCTVASNLCTLEMNRGHYEESIRYGQLSARFGEASSSASLLIAYTNLMDPYALTGQESAAMECLEKARKWLVPERRWKLRCTFYLEAASFALIQRNVALGLDLIAQLEGIVRGREDAVPMPGPYWKLKSFRMAQLGRSEEAYSIVSSLASRWRNNCVFHYLDIIATKAWLEHREEGGMKSETRDELGTFDLIGALGRKELLTLQGFLSPASGSEIGSSAARTIGSVRQPVFRRPFGHSLS